MKIFVRLLGILLGGLFIYAGGLKWLDPAQFAVDVQNYRLLPWWASVLVALYLPWLEIVCGLALCFKQFYRGALLLMTGMAVVFAAALGSAWIRGLDLECGCFGTGSSSVPVALARVCGILVVLGLLLWAESRCGGGDQKNHCHSCGVH